MAHVLYLTEWENSRGWTCGDVQELSKNSNYWYLIPRMLQLSLDKYIELLVKEYKVDSIDFIDNERNETVLLYSWKNQTLERKFKNFVNKKAKEKNFIICT